MQTRERRRYIRHPARFPIHAYKAGHPDETFSDLSDISHGGLCCSTPRKYAAGELVDVEIPLVAKQDTLHCEVVWTSEGTGGGYAYQCGMQFLGESIRSHAYILEQICRIEVYRRSQLAEHGRDLSPHEAAQEWTARCTKRFSSGDEVV